MVEYLFFPQANDIDKIIMLINIDDKEKYKDEEFIKVLIGDLAPRQARYYIHALRYLKLLDENKEFTNLGIKFRSLSSFYQEVEIIRLIMSDEVIGTMYLKDKIVNKLSKSEIAEMLEEAYPGFAPETYNRRAGNVRSWFNWISKKIDYFNN